MKPEPKEMNEMNETFNERYTTKSNSKSIIHSNVACRVEFLKFARIHPIFIILHLTYPEIGDANSKVYIVNP